MSTDAAWNVEVERVARPRVAAGALFFDEGGGSCCCGRRTSLGGRFPAGMSALAKRLIRRRCGGVGEELGIAPPLGRLLVVDWAPHPVEGEKVLFVFDGGLLRDEYVESIRADADEVSGYAFWPLVELGRLLIPRLARWVRAAVSARVAGETIYLEHGEVCGAR